MSKMDRQGARTPAQLEQRYRFGKSFSRLEEENTAQSRAISELSQNTAHGVVSLVGEVTGNKVIIKDISPVEHELTIKLLSYDVIDFTAVTVSRYGETEADELETYIPTADGVVKGVKSLYPITKLTTDTEGVVLKVIYNRDLNKVI